MAIGSASVRHHAAGLNADTVDPNGFVPMACTSISDLLAIESGRIGPGIQTSLFGKRIWPSIFKRGEFPSGMGYSLSTVTYERTAYTSAADDWESVTAFVAGEGGGCLPTATAVSRGYTARTYNVKRKVFQSDDFCAEDLRYHWQIADQLNSIFTVLKERVAMEWDKHNRYEYFLHCLYKVVVRSPSTTSTATMASSYPALAPDSILTQGVLDMYKVLLLRDGYAENNIGGNQNGAPVMTLICSPETSQRILKDDAGNNRNDLRYATPNVLLEGLGINKTFSGFIHMLDLFPRRFTYAGGTYTEVAPFSSSAATKGNKSDINASYRVAPYEESFIFHPDVVHQLIPNPVTNPGGNQQFDPVNYGGDWKFLNIPDRTCNPRGQIGFFHGILAAASKPVFPKLGVSFVHLRCDPALNLVTACGS